MRIAVEFCLIGSLKRAMWAFRLLDAGEFTLHGDAVQCERYVIIDTEWCPTESDRAVILVVRINVDGERYLSITRVFDHLILTAGLDNFFARLTIHCNHFGCLDIPDCFGHPDAKAVGLILRQAINGNCRGPRRWGAGLFETPRVDDVTGQ
jgi:hypothetical protein